MFNTGGAPHKPTGCVTVGIGDACKMGATRDGACRVSRVLGSGVQVAGKVNGVSVESAGPNGCCHCACQSQAATKTTAQASNERIDRMAFWSLVINLCVALRLVIPEHE